MKAIYSRLAAVVLLVFGVGQAASAVSVTVEDVVGTAGESVVVGLFVDGLTVELGPSGSGFFDLEAALSFDFNLSLTAVAPAASPAVTAAGFFWDLGPFPSTGLSPSTVGFNSIYNGASGDTFDFLNAEMLLLTFDVGAAGGTFPVAVSSFSYDGATVVPLPAAAWLLGGGLFALSFYRRRR